MKKCNAEIMKEIAQLNVKKEDLLNYESMNSTVTFLKGEEKTISEYNFIELNKEIDVIDQKVLYLKEKLAYSNATTIIPEFNITISSALTYLAILQRKKTRFYNLSKHDKLKRLGTTRDGQVEFEETLYNPSECGKIYEETCELITKLQMAIDRVNLTNLIEI